MTLVYFVIQKIVSSVHIHLGNPYKLFLILFAAPPVDPMITEVLTSTNALTVTWITPTIDGSNTSYNISISGSNVSVNINTSASQMVYAYTFEGLISDTIYTILIIAINCAGVNNRTEISRQTCKYFKSLHPSPFHISVNQAVSNVRYLSTFILTA